jgi:predicted ATPase
VASVQECERALQALAQRIADVDPEQLDRHGVTRALSCRVPDLDLVFTARLSELGLTDVRHVDGLDDGAAQVRLTATSDDLVSLVDGTLTPVSAWTSGRLRVEASVLDLLRLRSLLR